MRRYFSFLFCLCLLTNAFAQTPKTYTSSEILLQLKKLNVLGSVLYIAAHPDDENTRLLTYLANEKLYRTAYLSLTRGDGGQNLIGNEQGVELGLIRTQELLSARRLDGAEQFFSTAYDFGFSKSPEEAMKVWGHDKILSNVVWVIRKFKPDVIITRFPEDGRAGHGHHSASAILAREAFVAAADPTKFPEQLSMGVTIWQAKRIMWNTFNFGSTNTQSEDQFKLDVGMFNTLLGKGYGEIAALSRSQHKSQGFGVAAQRGMAVEYFYPTKGDKPNKDLLDGVTTTWGRTDIAKANAEQVNTIQKNIAALIDAYKPENPEKSLPALVKTYQLVAALSDGYWRQQKMKELSALVEECSGVYLEASTNTAYAVQGDSLRINVTVNNRLGISLSNTSFSVDGNSTALNGLQNNVNTTTSYTEAIEPNHPLTQPYWLANPMDKGNFTVTDQQLIGKPENDPLSASFTMKIEGVDFTFNKPIRYKYTDPVKGELYEPVNIIPVADVSFEREIYLLKEDETLKASVKVSPLVNKKISATVDVVAPSTQGMNEKKFVLDGLSKDKDNFYNVDLANAALEKPIAQLSASLKSDGDKDLQANGYRRIIQYDHIPTIVYEKNAVAKAVYLDIKTAGKKVGYIPGAGDKVFQALEEMGYQVTMLKPQNIVPAKLHQFDAIVTGVRAYNTNEWMNNAYNALMEYVSDGGVLVTQYNTSNQIGPVKARISPYNFTISRNRITDETATVNFLLPQDPSLNFPNKITAQDFEGWIQERSIYNAESIDSNYHRVLSMKDPGEQDQDGSLIIANYGKGKFVYTGLVFFRELPAGVPGAYRLFANLLAPLPIATTPAKNDGLINNANVKTKKKG